MTGGQDAEASAIGAGVAGAAAFAGAFRTVVFLLIVALAAELFAALCFLGRAMALAGVGAAAGLAACFTLAQRFF